MKTTMHAITVVAVLALGALGPWAHADDDLSQVGSVSSTSESNQQIYQTAKGEASEWLAAKRRAGEAVNKDDEIVQSSLGVDRYVEELRRDPVSDADAAAARAARHLDEARALHEAARAPVSDQISNLIGSDPQIQSILDAAAETEQGLPTSPPTRYLVTASRAMGDTAIKHLLDIGREHPDMAIVFRGVKPGETAQEMALWILTLQQPDADGRIANVVLDPTVFSGNGISTAPVLLRLNEQGGVLARAGGVANPQWIEDQVARGATGDLGTFGEIVEVSEEDLIDVMKRELAESNMKSRAETMVDNFWRSQPATDLPTATENRERTVDPTVVLVDGITAPDGTVIALPGQRLNPFDAIPFTAHVLVFDARDPAQITWAREQVVALEGKEVIPVMSSIDPDKGWEVFDGLVTGLGRHVYLLQPEMVERFQLERVPSIVEGGDRVLIVREFALDKKPSGGAGETASTAGAGQGGP